MGNLYQIYSVEPERYGSVSIEQLGLSIRLNHLLKMHGIMTVQTLFTQNRETLCDVIGGRNAQMLQEALERFLKEEEMKDAGFHAPEKKRVGYCMDVSEEVRAFFSSEALTQRAKKILAERSMGKTLSRAGEEWGLSKERVRQIEKSALQTITAWDRQMGISMLIRQGVPGEMGFNIPAVEQLLGENVIYMEYYWSTGASEYITYEPETGAYLPHGKAYIEEIKKVIDGLPDLIPASDYEALVPKLYPSELFDGLFYAKYKVAGKLYYRNTDITEYVCRDILRKCFPTGMHVHSANELNRFRECVRSQYGENVLPASDSKLVRHILRLSDVCGKGLYRVKRKVELSSGLTDNILKYIGEESKPSVMVRSIYSSFEKEMADEGIPDKDVLLGMLREKFGNRFTFFRDRIVKDGNASSLSEMIIGFIEQSSTPVTKNDIRNEFPGISEAMINNHVAAPQILSYCGSYYSLSNIRLKPEEKQMMRDVLEDLVREKGNVISRDIYDVMKLACKDCLERNHIFSAHALFSLLKALFGSSYRFERPYISGKNVPPLKPADLLYAKVRSSDRIKVKELHTMAKDMNYKIYSVQEFVLSCNGTHFLISAKELVSIDRLGITKDIAEEVDSLVALHISRSIPLAQMNCYDSLPEISEPWNEWLLFSVLYRWGTQVRVYLSTAQLRTSEPYVSPLPDKEH